MAAEPPGTPRCIPLSAGLNLYTVVVVERSGKRHRYIALAKTLHDAWLQASNTYGLMALSLIKPWRATPLSGRHIVQQGEAAS